MALTTTMKAVALTLAVLVGISIGATIQGKRDAQALKACQADRDMKAGQIALSSAALQKIDTDTQAALITADKAIKVARASAQAAELNADAYHAQLQTVEADLRAAQKDPKCAEQLRQQTCAALH